MCSNDIDKNQACGTESSCLCGDNSQGCCSNDFSEEHEDSSTPDENNELLACKSQLNEWKEKCLYVSADFQNYKNRIEKERLQWMASAQADILKKILVIVDDFERAMTQERHADAAATLAGFEMIYKNFNKFLQSVGVEVIPTTTEFNPHYHEALMEVDSPTHTSGQVIDILQKGYIFKGQVLRPAKVSVAK
jgi:molecular chaperone GrpE